MQPISEIWMSRNQRDWDAALKCYWEIPSVKKNREIEVYMDKPNLAETVKNFDQDEWYTFLDKYFRWKFTDPRFLPKRLQDLGKNSAATLLSVKNKLFAFDHRNIQKGLEITTSKKGIKGLGAAGASGLLAVLFPQYFGTADTLVVYALCQIDSLPEKKEVHSMVKIDRKTKKKSVQLNEKEAGLLINIMRRKATELNALFRTDKWTPRRVEMVLWILGHRTNVQCLSRAKS